LRLFVALLEEDDQAPDRTADDNAGPDPIVVINPHLTVVDDEIVEDWEGCLSIPDIRGRVPRARAVSVRALDRRANPIELRESDFSARVIQHETDHLDGVLFFDRMRRFESLTFLEEYAKYWRQD
jgi:peptide deformylase